MNILHFENCLAWQKAEILSLDLYNKFKSCRDFSFRDQLQRAAISIMNNIAEGFERRTHKELANFLNIAKGSCGEVRSMLHMAFKLGYISRIDYERYCNLCIEISKLLFGFIKSL
jgi:four helix bundle protein